MKMKISIRKRWPKTDEKLWKWVRGNRELLYAQVSWRFSATLFWYRISWKIVKLLRSPVLEKNVFRSLIILSAYVSSLTTDSLRWNVNNYMFIKIFLIISIKFKSVIKNKKKYCAIKSSNASVKYLLTVDIQSVYWSRKCWKCVSNNFEQKLLLACYNIFVIVSGN